jgi:uncharacterized repeat protein (TIGR03803 family)
MKKRSFSLIFPVPIVAVFVFLSASIALGGAKGTIILRFNVTNGLQPQNGLIADSQGNLYGVTTAGGITSCFPRGCGVVFELSPGSNDTWTEKVLYRFKGGTADTDIPTTDLIFDTKGNLFGATAGDLGAIYELSPGTGGTWSEKVIYRFTNDGNRPGVHLAFDREGNLYGSLGQVLGATGGVFQLSPQSDGTWKQSILHTFNGGADGQDPRGGVVLDSKGNLYGVTQDGGAFRRGIVYELSPNGSGGWVEAILYSFMGQVDGQFPIAPLTIDAKGNLYGTTLSGGANNSAVVFELHQSASKWSETVLFTFDKYGSSPNNVVFDAKGNLYGTTVNGGTGCNNPGCGIVFKLTRQTTPPWKATVLHNFGSDSDGSEPLAGVVVENSRLYGTTQYGGGRYGYGTVFDIQP